MRVASIVLLLTALARADATPCTGCILELADRRDGGAVPLLVVLHGDRDHAANSAARWRAAARAKGWAVLALECPVADGCKGSWWQWNGDPAWITARVAAVTAKEKIDPARIYLAGWSGGASYIGLHSPAWPEVFAAVVIHGGGEPPKTSDCPTKTLPAYFLVGDANPLHGLARDLRTWFETCKDDVVWDLVPKGDHDKESRALTKAKAAEILDWLAAHPRT